MKRLNFKELCELQVGDEITENEYGMSFTSTVCKEPEVVEVNGSRHIRFVTTDISNGELVDYMVTEGWEHYGPKVYKG